MCVVGGLGCGHARSSEGARAHEPVPASQGCRKGGCGVPWPPARPRLTLCIKASLDDLIVLSRRKLLIAHTCCHFFHIVINI